MGISAKTLPAETLCNPLILMSLTTQESSSLLIGSIKNTNTKSAKKIGFIKENILTIKLSLLCH